MGKIDVDKIVDVYLDEAEIAETKQWSPAANYSRRVQIVDHYYIKKFGKLLDGANKQLVQSMFDKQSLTESRIDEFISWLSFDWNRDSNNKRITPGEIISVSCAPADYDWTTEDISKKLLITITFCFSDLDDYMINEYVRAFVNQLKKQELLCTLVSPVNEINNMIDINIELGDQDE